MATYVIGDLQGCYQPFLRLLDKINFSVTDDALWLVGDLVNRGPQSLEILRWLKNFQGTMHCVLGNHDLHLLAVAFGVRPLKSSDTFTDVLKADDRDELLFWLRQQPLVYYEPSLHTIMAHAGIYPFWHLSEALAYALEFQQLLAGEHYAEFFLHLYQKPANTWNKQLDMWQRYCFIVNAFTRMRVINPDHSLNTDFDQTLEQIPDGCKPWFQKLLPEYHNMKIVFGHWAALMGKTYTKNVFALDTGCVWGQYLTAMRLEDDQLFSVAAGG